MKVKIALLTGSILAVPALAMAQPVNGLYVGLAAGPNIAQNQTFKGLTLPGGATVLAHDNPKFAVGYEGSVSIGYGLENGLRLELEGNYRNNQVRTITGFGQGKGRQEQYGAMINALYAVDLSFVGLGFLAPYVGVGAGWERNNWDTVRAGVGAGGLFVNKAASGLAVQGIIGTEFPLVSIDPGLALTVEYRIMDMPGDRKYNATLGGVGGKLKVRDDFNHSLMFGLRYAFNPSVPAPPAPAPAPVAAPAPAPSRTYLVFFDWDRADLTERARQIIAQAAQNSTRVQYTRIEVSGHADRTGTAKYNQALSMRRAQNVASELVKDGVPQSAIDVKAYGDTRPLVPTAAGVREPQNRRVEIVLH